MSDDGNPPISLEEAIKWFVSLTPEQQFATISQLFKDPTSIPEQDRRKLSVIIYECRYQLNHSSKEKVIEYLKSLKLEENIAIILVENVIKLRPTPSMDARALRTLIDDNKFSDVVNAIIVGFYLKGRDIDTLANEIGIERGILDSARRLFHYDIHRYLGGMLPIEDMEFRWTNEYKMSPAKVSRYLEIFQQNIQAIRDVLVFQAVSSYMEDIETIKDSLSKMWKQLEELASALKEAGSGKADIYH